MSEESPFVITLYDKSYARQGWLGDPEELDCSVVHNDVGDARITVSAKNRKLPLLMERGARAVIEYEDEYLIGGKIRVKSGKGPSVDGSMSFRVLDDFRLLKRIEGWPVPSAPLNAQVNEYHTLSGPAETVVKAAVQANAIDRAGEPVTCAPDLGRGDNITAAFRFHPLYDRLFPAVDTAGIGVTVRQSGAGLVVDCYEPQLHPRELSEYGGTILGWDWETSEAEATHLIIGGQGEGVARTFQEFPNAALAAAIGERIEVFRDARDSGDGDVYAERAAETFAETAPKAGLSVTLAETSVFRYGGPGGVHVGDRVNLRVGDGLTITDTLRSVHLTWGTNGIEVTPSVGDVEDNPDQQLAKALSSVAAGVRDLRRR